MFIKKKFKNYSSNNKHNKPTSSNNKLNKPTYTKLLKFIYIKGRINVGR